MPPVSLHVQPQSPYMYSHNLPTCTVTVSPYIQSVSLLVQPVSPTVSLLMQPVSLHMQPQSPLQSPYTCSSLPYSLPRHAASLPRHAASLPTHAAKNQTFYRWFLGAILLFRQPFTDFVVFCRHGGWWFVSVVDEKGWFKIKKIKNYNRKRGDYFNLSLYQKNGVIKKKKKKKIMSIPGEEVIVSVCVSNGRRGDYLNLCL